jgi:hypothetical protein
MAVGPDCVRSATIVARARRTGRQSREPGAHAAAAPPHASVNPFVAGGPLAPFEALPDRPTAGPRRWYGGTTLTVQGTSLAGGLVLSFASGNVAPAFAGLGAAVLAPPIVHWSHGHVGTGFVSLAIMTGTTGLGAFLGAEAACAGNGCRGDMGGFGQAIGGAAGALGGLIAATVFDITVLAWEEPREYAPERAHRSGGSWAPVVSLGPDHAALGAGGLF